MRYQVNARTLAISQKNQAWGAIVLEPPLLRVDPGNVDGFSLFVLAVMI